MPQIDKTLVAKGYVPVLPEALYAKIDKRKPGYLEAFLQVAQVSNDTYYITQEDFTDLRERFTPEGIKPKPQAAPKTPTTQPTPRNPAGQKPKPRTTHYRKPTPIEQRWVDQFFNNRGGNLFEGAGELWQEWADTLEKAGGAGCSACARNGLRIQYTTKVLARLGVE
jgi:hypothetical protein